MTRSAPNSSMKPSVTLKAPPKVADVLAHDEHALVARASPRAGRRRSPGGRSSWACQALREAAARGVAVAEHDVLALVEQALGAVAGSGIGERSASSAAASISRADLGAQRVDVDPELRDARAPGGRSGPCGATPRPAPWARTSCRRGRRGRACASSRPRSASGRRRRSRARAPPMWPRTSPRRRCRRRARPGSRTPRRARPGRRRTARSSGVE